MAELPASRRRRLVVQYLGGRPPEPPPLVGDGLMHPLGITLLYGAPGIGKGWIACHVIRSLQEEGYKPLILDFEGVTYEWRQRLWGMGIEQVPYISFSGPLSLSTAGEVNATAEDHDWTHVILDSASAAKAITSEGDAGGQDVTMTLFRTLKMLRVPALMIGHQGKNGTTPIGSIHFISQSRIVWHATGVANGTELEMIKANDRPKLEEHIVFTRVPDGDGRTNVVKGWTLPVEPEPETLTEAIMRVMAGTDKSLTPADVHRTLTLEGNWQTSQASINTQMSKLADKGKLYKPYRGHYRLPTNLPPLEVVG